MPYSVKLKVVFGLILWEIYVFFEGTILDVLNHALKKNVLGDWMIGGGCYQSPSGRQLLISKSTVFVLWWW
jgi:hypothetical protein